MRSAKLILSVGLFVALVVASCTGESVFPLGSEVQGLTSPIMVRPSGTKVVLSDYFMEPGRIDSIQLPDELEGTWSTDRDTLYLNGILESGFALLDCYIEALAYSIPLKMSPEQLVRFEFFPFVNYEEVYLTGDFNGWSKDATPMTWGRDGGMGFSAELSLLPGDYSYQLIVNGEYMLDPSNPKVKSNGMGGYNSVRSVAPPSAHSVHLDFVRLSKHQIAAKKAADIADIAVLFDNHKIDHTERNDSIFVSIPALGKDTARHHVRVFVTADSGSLNAYKFPTAGDEFLTSSTQLDRFDKERTIMYFAMVDRFKNGDPNNDEPLNDDRVAPRANYRGGDLAGLEQVLNDGYFDDLGINTLWISPITQNPREAFQEYPEPRRFYSGYHGYWPILFTKVDHRFGDASALHALVKSAHGSNKNIILDFVSNHVHEQHPFIQAHPAYATELVLPDGSKNLRRWDEHRLTTWFDEFLPSFDFCQPEVVETVGDSALFWLREFNFDGFRHDATKHIPVEYWRSVTQKVKALQGQTGRSYFQVGETFGDRALIQSYVGSGMMDGQFDFNLYFDARNALAYETGDLRSLATSLDATLLVHGPLHSMCNITGNHDLPRFISLAGKGIQPGEDEKEVGWQRDVKVEDSAGFDRLKLLQTWISTIPGIPVVYYGDEIGMPGANDPDNRRMMKFNVLSETEIEVKEHLSTLLKLRGSSMALTLGAFRWIYIGEKALIYERSYLGERVIVAMNSGTDKIEINAPYKSTSDEWRAIDSTAFTMTNDRLNISLPPLSSTCIINRP